MNPKNVQRLWWGGLAALLLVCPFLMPSQYWLHIVNLTGLFIVVSVGLNILTGSTGQLSVGQAAFFGIGAYTAALSSVRLGLPFSLAMVAALLVGALAGLIMGLPTLKLKGPYLVMATVGFAEAIRLIMVNWVSVTRGTGGIINIPGPHLGSFVFRTEEQYFYLIYGLAALSVLAAHRLNRSKIGRALAAIREDELAAEAMGVPVFHFKIVAFVLSAVYAAAAGGLFAAFQTYISPDSFTFDDSIAFISMVVVGGSGRIYGAVVGAVSLTLLSELLRPFKNYRLLIYGFILILSVVYLPQGLAGLWESNFRRKGGVRRWLSFLKRSA